MQETHLVAIEYESVLPRRFYIFSEYFDSSSSRVSRLLSRFLDVIGLLRQPGGQVVRARRYDKGEIVLTI